MDYTVHGILQARILEWVAFPFSRGSSRPRNWTRVSCIAGRFFTCWATREVSVSLVLTYLIIKCFGIIFSMFLMLGIHWASWICEFILFISFGKNSLIVSSNISPLFPLFLCLWGLQLHIYHTCVSSIQERTLVSHLTKQTCPWLLADESVGRGGLDLPFCYKHVPLLGLAPPVWSMTVATDPPVAMELWTVASHPRCAWV